MTLKHLRRLAEAATQGHWVSYGKSVWTGGKVVTSAQTDADAVYIAAVNPAAVLALVAEVERLRADVHTLSCRAEDADIDGRNPLVTP